jgi:ABC-type bacteriocin/lantibiotic exporter with double-glycine peptidase domain
MVTAGFSFPRLFRAVSANRHTLLAIVCVLLFVEFSHAQAFQIAPQNMVANPGSYCGYASLETVARHQGITQMAGMTQHRVANGLSGLTYQSDLVRELQSRNISYEARPRGAYDMGFVTQAVSQNRGVVVTFGPLPGRYYDHSVVLTGFQNNQVYTYNPDHPGKMTVIPRETFNARWRGDALTIRR